MNNAREEKKLYAGKRWIAFGLSWGVIMATMNVIWKMVGNKESLTLQDFIISLIVWSVTGLVVGYILKMQNNNRIAKQMKEKIEKTKND